ncbi:ribosomal protein S17 [Chloroherpeton thalassium ATCC 35110]|uniref:Small ribosomal subunit protein uS17 n=1 Tax=Chloroherpeton thalassium (strain ATCC 35110 / GB-78) TaxID=517418 RepID=B3QYD3_CHLT3|nr:30S ribosomal protein S17 [Chloroherpeton thalassium]ACF13561.1 ribosomal protein S17 [Chloroherpeton thalassium ATCC 35110]
MSEEQNTESQSQANTAERNRRKERVGKVVSNKMQKSIVVAVERYVQHRVYKKYYKQTTKIMAHDEKNDAKLGDTVRIMESRPLSKRKAWRLVEIIERAK